MIKIKWTEPSRVSELEFRDMQEFGDWIKEQWFNTGETIEVL